MKCRLCQQSNLPVFVSWDQFPIYIWPIEPRHEQEYAHLNVHYCATCGLVQIDRFDEAFIKKLYSPEVFGLVSTKEFATTRSRNNAFLQYCAAVLGHGWEEGKAILDVGGYDLLTAFDLQFAHAVICDPNAVIQSKANVTIIKDFFNTKYFKANQFDVVILKHIVEHIDDPCSFLYDINSVLIQDGIVIIEVPDLTRLLKDGSYSIFYHQHLLYFDSCSLGNLLKQSGFNVAHVLIEKGFIRIVAQKINAPITSQHFEKDPHTRQALQSYSRTLAEYVNNLDAYLARECMHVKGICYGAGGGTTILSHLSRNFKEGIEWVVDSSIFKIGKRIGGTPYTVQSPDILQNHRARRIFINSAEYFDEIYQSLQTQYADRDFQCVRVTPHLEQIDHMHRGHPIGAGGTNA